MQKSFLIALALSALATGASAQTYYPQQESSFFGQLAQGFTQGLVGTAPCMGQGLGEGIAQGVSSRVTRAIVGGRNQPVYINNNSVQQCMNRLQMARQQDLNYLRQRQIQAEQVALQERRRAAQLAQQMAPRCTYREKGGVVTRECQGTKLESDWIAGWAADVSDVDPNK